MHFQWALAPARARSWRNAIRSRSSRKSSSERTECSNVWKIPASRSRGLRGTRRGWRRSNGRASVRYEVAGLPARGLAPAVGSRLPPCRRLRRWKRSSSRCGGTGREAVHRVHAVAVRDGAIVAAAGDAGSYVLLRSSAKPLQALPLARARDDLDERDLAIASASHRATPDQLAAVRALLAKAPATEDDLELGLQEGRPPERIEHNCSGKHAGMLALCRAPGWPRRATACPTIRVQQAACAVPTRRRRGGRRATCRRRSTAAASSPSRSRSSGWRTRSPGSSALAAGARVAAAMRAHPDLIGGPVGRRHRG